MDGKAIIAFDAKVYDVGFTQDYRSFFGMVIGCIDADADVYGDDPTITCTVPANFAMLAHRRRIRVTMELLDEDERE